MEKSCILHIPIIVASEKDEKKVRKKLVKGVMEEERVRPSLSPRYGYCRLFASVNGSPDSFERVGRRFTTIGCSGKDGKSAQGNGGLSIRNDDASMYRSELALFEDVSIHNVYCILKLKRKL